MVWRRIGWVSLAVAPWLVGAALLASLRSVPAEASPATTLITSASPQSVGARYPGRAAVALPRLHAAVSWQELPFRSLITPSGPRRELPGRRWSLTDRWQAWHVTLQGRGTTPGCRRGGALGLWHCGAVTVGPKLLRIANALHWVVQLSGMPAQSRLSIRSSQSVQGPVQLRSLDPAGPLQVQITLQRGEARVTSNCSTASSCALSLTAGTGPVQMQLSASAASLPLMALRLARLQR